MTYLVPLIYLNSNEKYTVALGLANFTAQYGATSMAFINGCLYGFFVLPCLILYFFAQSYFIQGIVITGVKG